MTPRILLAAIAAALATVPVAANPTPVADATRGAAATVSGTVAGVLSDDEFRLSDTTGSLRVYIGPNPMPVAVGEQVTVSGIIDDEGPGIELYARQIIQADGMVIDLPNVDE